MKEHEKKSQRSLIIHHMVHRFYKHKLPLDDGFPPCWYFPMLNQRFDVKHIKTDLRKIGLPDEQVYALAMQLKRLIVTYNDKDFKPLAPKSKETGVIGVTPTTPYPTVDKKLMSLLTKSTAKALQEKFTPLLQPEEQATWNTFLFMPETIIVRRNLSL